MLDFLRSIRDKMNQFSKAEVLGLPMDWFFHLVGMIVFVFVVSRVLSVKKTIVLGFALMIAKEVVDVFAKSRLEYIRPPTVDLVFDLTAGLVGLGLGYLLAHRYPNVFRFTRSTLTGRDGS